MAFQFVPPFNEGDKQTNPETKVEYIFTSGAWRPLGPKIEDEFDTLDERYAKKTGDTFTGRVNIDRSSGEAIRIEKNGETTLQLWSAGNIETKRTSFNDNDLIPKWAADVMIRGNLQDYLPLSGGTLTDMLKFNKGDKDADQFKIIPNSSDYHTNIYTTGNGQLRFRTSHTGLHTDNVGSHIVLDPKDGVPETKIYNVVETNSSGAVPRSYVDDAVDGLATEQYVDDAVDGLATEQYVNDVENSLTEQINQIDSSEVIVPGNSPSRPPGLRFGYVSGSSVTNGKFAWYDNGGRRLKISATSKDFPWGTDSPTGDITYSEAHLFHIYATTTSNGQDKWRIKTTGSFNRMDWHTNHILLYVPYSLSNGSFSESADYYITIAGLF